MKLSIVGSALNEEIALPSFVAQCAAACSALALPYEIVLVNDGSRDGTARVAEELAKSHPLKVLRHHAPQGITRSLADGIAAAEGDVIVFLPTDMESHPEEDIPVLMQPLLDDAADFVIGWRTGRSGPNLGKAFLSNAFNFLASALFGTRLHDGGWVRAFRREIMDNLPPLRADWHRYMAYMAGRERYRVKEVRTAYYPRPAAWSNFGILGLGRIPVAFFSILSLKMLLAFSKNPMVIFGTLGTLMLSGGGVVGLYILYLNYIVLGNVQQRTPLILLFLLLGVMGVQFLSLGFLADLLLSRREKR